MIVSNLLFAVQISWDVLRYTADIGARPTGCQGSREAKLRKRYPPDAHKTSGFLSSPCIIHDVGGRIICWNLPEVLLLDRQVSVRSDICQLLIIRQEHIWAALSVVQPAFLGTIGKIDAPWRINPENFKSKGTCEPLPGNLNFSPAWFQQAHHVSQVSIYCIRFV